VLQLFRVLSFQTAELVVPPVVGGLGQVDVSQRVSNVTGFGTDLVSILNFANYLIP
jgi:hypothetical protein